MSPEMLASVLDPFTTSRLSRKVGLAFPSSSKLLKLVGALVNQS